MGSGVKKIRNTAKVILIIYFLVNRTISNGQEPQMRSQKYKDAYKKYQYATCPIPKDSIQHFVFFSRDRESIINHPFLKHPMFKGAQIMYSWKDFEPRKGHYDFTFLMEDYNYLKKFGKKLWVQLQDATFRPEYKAVPEYLYSDDYDGGATIQYNDDGKPEGWVAKRWNKKVRERFALLLQELGAAFDGKIEGINLQETSIGVNTKTDPSFSDTGYVIGLKANMLALKKSFPVSATMIYANFMPGEWLPMDDKGYLRSIYRYGQEIGVGLGGPDLMVTRPGQLNHAYTLMHEGEYTVPIGIAVQDGNYTGTTGIDLGYLEKSGNGVRSRNNIVPLLHAFAKDFLRVKYIFWVNQEPYFKEDVLPCFPLE